MGKGNWQERALEEIKEMLKSEGKEDLVEFAEDLAGLGWESVKIFVKHSPTKIDDIVVATMDGVVTGFIDKIDGKKD